MLFPWFFPCLIPVVLLRVWADKGAVVGSPILAHSNMVLGLDQCVSQPSLKGTPLAQPVNSGWVYDLAPLPRHMEVLGVAPQQSVLMCSGLSADIQSPFYALKWKIFAFWCTEYNLDPNHCLVSLTLEILQSQFSMGTAPATLKVYVGLSLLSMCLWGVFMLDDTL